MRRRPGTAIVRAMLLGAALLAISGCGLPQQAKDAVQRRQAEAEQAALQAAGQGPAVRSGTVAVHEGIWVGGRSLVNPHGDALPAAAEGAHAVVLNSMGAGLRLKEIAAEVTAQTTLPVILDERGGPAPASGRPPPAAERQAERGMSLAWNGPLSGLLDSVATFFGLQWEYRGGQVRIFRDEVRTFTLAALPSSSTIRAGVNTTGAGGGVGASPAGGVGGAAATAASGGTSSSGSMLQDTTNEATIKLWDDIKGTIEAMLPPGAKVAMSPATGTVTVLAPPLAMRRVASYIEQQNARITRQVTVSVKVLRVDLGDTYDLGLDLGVVFQQLAGQYAIDLAGPAPLKVAGATAPATYLIKALPNPNPNGPSWATSSNATRAAVDALQTMGKVTLVTETSVTTLNGQAAPVSVAEQQSYVSSTATTLAAGLGATSQTQVSPATLITGFNMQVLPRVLDDGEILLQYGLSLSDLKAMNTFNANGTQVQLPDVNIRSFLQEARLKSGDLLVLAGYQSTTDSLNNTGLPDLGPSLFGGSVQAIRGKSVIVIMMTPQLQARGAGGGA